MSEPEHPIQKAQKLALIGEQAAGKARRALLTAFRDVGVTEQVMAVCANDLLFATKQKAQFDVKAGEFKYSKQMTDNTTRLNALKLILDIHNVMPPKQVDINDKRQTRELAGELFKRIEQQGLLGIDDKNVPIMDDAEAELMTEMVKRKDGTYDMEEDDGIDDD